MLRSSVAVKPGLSYNARMSVSETVAPPQRRTKETPDVRLDGGPGIGWDSQVVLWNDDVNFIEHVILSLMEVFGHGQAMAEKIAIEAHRRGRAIAEVETRKKAEQHAKALRDRRLRATVEDVS